jgi:hypothetical protein
MSENQLNDYQEILFEDLEAYLKGLEENNFGFCNIISNRIITDAIVLKSEKFCLIGAILKDITYDFRFIPEENKLVRILKKLDQILHNYMSNKDEMIAEKLFDDYNIYYQSYRKTFKSNLENYKENIIFASLTSNFFLEFYLNELKNDDIPINLNVLIFGIISEVNRVLKNFGSNPKLLALKLVLTYFGRMFEYYRFFLSEENKSDRWTQSYSKFKENIIVYLKKFIADESYIESSSKLLFEICKEWRFMFLRMLEIPKRSIIEKQVEVPNKVKEDLNEIVSDLINTKLEEKLDD